jgi:hypothetical protein
LAVASSGIAALLLPGGRTAHSLFKIPLKLYSDSSCQLSTNSPVAKLILEAVAIVWDEAGMHPSYGFEAVDRLCRDITKIDRPFGGKTIICGGDFRQVLPVIPKASKSSTLDQTLKRSKLWPLFRKFKLVQNMRVDRNALEFSEFLMDIGNGVGTEISNLIDIPGHLFTPENNLDSLISFVYDDFEINCLSTDYLSNRAILTPTNSNVDQINSKVLDMFPGATKVYLSADSVEAAETVNSNLYPVELLNSLAPNGIPSHELRLKVGVPIIILRNLILVSRDLKFFNDFKVLVSRDLKFFNDFKVMYHDYRNESEDSEYARVELNDDDEHLNEITPRRVGFNINPPESVSGESTSSNSTEYQSVPTDEESNPSVNLDNLQSSNLGPAWTINENSARAIRRANREQLIHMVDSHHFVQKIPKHYSDIKNLPESEKKEWQAAILAESSGLLRKDTMHLIPKNDIPPNTQLLSSTWTFDIKQDGRKKARFCIRGDLVKEEHELQDIFSTVSRTENIRLILTICAAQNWSFATFDVKQAFVNATLPKPVYLKIPVGFEGDTSKQVYKVTKALYGLKQSPAEWNKELANTLKLLSFHRSKSDWNLFYKRTESKTIFLAVHVDDGLIVANEEFAIQEFIKTLETKYEIKFDANPKLFLNISITRNPTERSILLNQTKYIEECCEKFNISNMKPYHTPMEPGFVKDIQPDDTPLDKSIPYRSIIGALLHIARMTRFDVLYAVSILSCHVNEPQLKHWHAAKRILAYLKTTKNHSLKLGGEQDFSLKCYSDSTWGDDTTNRRSRSGGVMFFNNSLISAWSKQQSTAALSSTDAEYQAMSMATQEILYYRQLLQELHYIQQDATPLFGDNQGAMDLTVSTKNHPRVKHIDIRFHFIREQVELKTVEVKYVPTAFQIADIFTKPLARNLFEKFKDMLYIRDWWGIDSKTFTDDVNLKRRADTIDSVGDYG